MRRHDVPLASSVTYRQIARGIVATAAAAIAFLLSGTGAGSVTSVMKDPPPAVMVTLEKAPAKASKAQPAHSTSVRQIQAATAAATKPPAGDPWPA